MMRPYYLTIVSLLIAAGCEFSQDSPITVNDVIVHDSYVELEPETNHASALLAAIENKQSDVQVVGQGTVIKNLRDDLEGSRHQKFILKLDSGETILFAHNIDLAPRIDDLEEGDSIKFCGEFEWNDKGGVIHWTHHDPQKKHPDGWIKHDGKTYQ